MINFELRYFIYYVKLYFKKNSVISDKNEKYLTEVS